MTKKFAVIIIIIFLVVIGASYSAIKFSNNKLPGDSNLDGITNCEDIYHIFDAFFVSQDEGLGNSDYDKNGEIDHNDAGLLMTDLKAQGTDCLFIKSILPLSGPVGTEVVLEGVGFDLPFPGEFSEPQLYFGEGVLSMWEWEDIWENREKGNRLSFKVPSEMCKIATARDCFQDEGLIITPGVYEIFYDSAFGQSNKVKFTVTP